MIEQFHYELLLSKLELPIVKGKALNIGLGPGASARLMLDSRRIDTVTSVEMDQAVIDAYVTKYQKDENEQRHTILNAKASLVDYIDHGPFDMVLTDIVNTASDAEFEELLATLAKLAAKGALNAQSGVLIEAIGNFKQERTFEFWLDDNLWTTQEMRPALAEIAVGRAAAMRIYHPPETGFIVADAIVGDK